MASADRLRIEIGFDGGQIMSALVDASGAEQIERALAAGSEKSLSFEADDGRYTIALTRVVYLKRFAREARVGFGS